MRLQILGLIFLILISCQRENRETIPKDKLELILLGVPEILDTSDLTKLGIQKYFYFDGKDSVTVKSCTYIDDRTGEIIQPMKCSYYTLKLDKEQQSNFDFFIKYTRTLPPGELIKNRNNECYCDLFGGWIAIHTDKNGIKKHFLFDCCNLPDSIHDLCEGLHGVGLDSNSISIKTGITINTDSIVFGSTKILAKEFKTRREKYPAVKFESGK